MSRRRWRSCATNPSGLCLAARLRRRCSRATAVDQPDRGAQRRGVHLRLRGLQRPAVLFGAHTGPGAFYRLMPHNAMALCSAPRSSMRSSRWSWACAPSGATSASPSACGRPGLALAGDAGRRRAALSRRRRRRLLQRGRAADRPAPALSPPDVLRFPAVLRVDLRGDALSLSARPQAPYPWYDLPVVLGTLGGIGLVIGRSACYGKIEARSRAVDQQRATAWTSPSSPCCS